MNPCGRAVDIGREFNTRVAPGKLFSNSADEVEVIWYPALKTAPDLGRVSIVARPEWDADQQEWAEGGVSSEGEWLNRAAVPGALGAHVCGTDEQFRDGCERDTSLPDVLYGAFGLPQCCAPPVPGAAGGAGGGRASLVWTLTPGASCAAATLFPVDSGQQNVAFPPGPSDSWFKFPTVSGTTYRVLFTPIIDLPDMQVSEGLVCLPTPFATFFGFNGPQSVDHTATMNGFFWLSIFGAFGVSVLGLEVITLP